MAILKLRDEGKLSLDDPAERYVPELEGAQLSDHATRRGSRSAICSRTRKGSPKTTRGATSSSPTARTRCRRCCAAASRSRTRPASRTSTPTTASPSSAASSRSVSKMPYGDYVAANILKPLGMTSTTLEPADVPAGAPRARLSLGGRAVEGRAAAGERLVRLDGRDADVGARSRAATSASSCRHGRRATAPRPRRSGGRRCARCSSCRVPGRHRCARDPSGSIQLNSGGYGFGLARLADLFVPPHRRAQRRAAGIRVASCAGCRSTASASSRSATSPTRAGAASRRTRSTRW